MYLLASIMSPRKRKIKPKTKANNAMPSRSGGSLVITAILVAFVAVGAMFLDLGQLGLISVGARF